MKRALGQLTQDATSQEEISIGPLIDIVFILLIFFVVTTTFARDLGLEIQRPQAHSGSEQPARLVRVAVSTRGEITVDAQPTPSWRVEATVKDALSLHSEKRVLLFSDQEVPARSLVELIDACRRAGASDVAVAVENAT
jgi:biopolymer transport protein ExbD